MGASGAAIVGVGATPYYKRGQSVPQTPIEMACKAILAALDDAGLTADDLDGFAYYNGGYDTSLIAQILGVPEVRFTASLTGGGGGSAGSIGLAAAAVVSGHAEVVVSVMSLQQAASRLGGGGYLGRGAAEKDFVTPAGLVAPGQEFALLTMRHMHLYGTTREHLAEVAISTRANAVRRPTSMMRDPLTLDDYFAARMISEPLCLFDYCMENDGAVALVTTSTERAADLRQKPAHILSSAIGGAGRWGQAIGWMGMPDEYFASSGHRPVAERLYDKAGLGPADVDVAELYDHFSALVLFQLEDYGFCGIGESGPYVADGNIRWPDGGLPVNTHGGNLSDVYLGGITHIVEGVEQIRGTAVNQVAGAEVALVTGGPASLPVSALLLGVEAR